MKISKNSLLVRMVFYNNIAIIVASITVALFLTFIAFQNIEMKVIDSARDKISLVNRAYNGEILRAKDDLNRIIRNIPEIEDNSSHNKYTYTQRADIIKNQLVKIDKKLYSESIVSIVDDEGNVLGEASDANHSSKIDKSNFRRNLSNADSNIKTSYFSKVDDDIYTRIIVKYGVNSGKRHYILLTLPMNLPILKELGILAGLNEQDKIFLLVGDKYKYGTFAHIDDDSLNLRKEENPFTKRGYNYLYKKRKVNNDTYYIVLSDLYNYNIDYIGSMGIGIYYENIEIMKIIVSLSVIFIVLLFVTISTTISAKLFSRLLEPLSRIVAAAEEVSKGNYKINVKPEGVDEMRTLSKTFNQMAADIRENQQQSVNKNRKLMGTLKRIDAIEKILMSIQIEDDMNVTVKEILHALTSEMGLGYSRAMYFRYSREIDTMVGELSVVNNKVKKEAFNSDDNTGGFKFQIEELDKLIHLIKIPFKSENLIAKALIEKRIISYNEKGYKYTLGNDLFKSLGIKNFLIMPIYSEVRNYGCIVVDYYGKDNIISQEEIELLTLLFLNISIRIKNKTLEEEKIDYERTATIGKLVDRFFNGRELSFEKMLEFMERMYEYDYNNAFLKIQIQEIKNEISKLRREKEILNEYVTVKKNNPLEIIDIEKLFYELIDELEPALAAAGVNISTFINYNGMVLGNRSRLKRAFYEIIKNAKESFEGKADDNKKINIIVTKEKNIDKIKINIIDNGKGMTQDQLTNIFEPFVGYNQNAPGLGLSIVSRIIKDHHGVIKYSSRLNEGTDVKITLNIYKEEII
ncbi:Adaptive-response sensory-kinase SasA [Fusobacterium sp. DD29]|uniref:sensor histidine kinase n=1 Tax=unclassified Fusobacterium TaxID=2648384 RepID=UPI001B8D46DF|nr:MULTISPECIES: sensor histidine kinase [unclassified Fusobacterium]MBR8701838.1 Adaptive-response sensory-kinase SasA [Fusobacterium sp. DD45]MBR8711619.1 Adaptive-response sensory-kinase SasA [Fusobacterium sp. DD28]MBR8750054.1 Adaptive-response sensory-kinase SasA [Fusobacterium sp. DD29]MBR8752168.1 Adaptive-response sensory-kinase SasA [Fusobacterium sp. DD26]MBR8762296.1 Adaptive-response sensory-kinase SasA [Fusobacterium sp. DD25]